MSKKFSVMETIIDFDKLDRQIREYKMLHQFDDPYLFMSEDTAKRIEVEVGANNIIIDNDTLASKINNTNGVYATYTGYKVFINNDLKFGIVEIR